MSEPGTELGAIFAACMFTALTLRLMLIREWLALASTEALKSPCSGTRWRWRMCDLLYRLLDGTIVS